MIEVKVPKGGKPGDVIVMPATERRPKLRLKLPANAEEGMILRVQVPAATYSKKMQESRKRPEGSSLIEEVPKEEQGAAPEPSGEELD